LADGAKRAYFAPTKVKFVRNMEAKADATREKALAKRRKNAALKKVEKEAAGGTKSEEKAGAKRKAMSKGLKGRFRRLLKHLLPRVKPPLKPNQRL